MTGMDDDPTFGEELVQSAREALEIAEGTATAPCLFVPIAELPGWGKPKPGPLETPEFIARQVAALDARRRQGMNLAVAGEGGRIVKIAPDGTEKDITDELDREVERARRRMGQSG